MGDYTLPIIYISSCVGFTVLEFIVLAVAERIQRNRK